MLQRRANLDVRNLAGCEAKISVIRAVLEAAIPNSAHGRIARGLANSGTHGTICETELQRQLVRTLIPWSEQDGINPATPTTEQGRARVL